jgi:RND superfamily putative drug exporter
MSVPERLARWSSSHPWRAVAVWSVAVAGALVALAVAMGQLTSEGTVTGNPESRQAMRLAMSAFPASQRHPVSDMIVVRSERLSVNAPAFRRLVRQIESDVRRTGRARELTSYLDQPSGQLISRDRHAAVIPLYVNTTDSIGPIVAIVQRAQSTPGFSAFITGDRTVDRDFSNLATSDMQHGELQIGAPAALIVLLLVFGAVVAGSVPLLMATVSIIVGLGLVAVLSQVFALSTFIINMLTGMGLALGIDYSLFVISRYREERGGGQPPMDAIAVAGATASRAVLFSGSTFVVAMFGMLIIRSNVMRSLALGAIVVGIVSVAVALTLLPGVLGLLKDRVNALRLPLIGTARSDAASSEGRFWRAVIHRVLRRPLLSLVVVTGLLIAAATPLFGVTIGTHSVSTMPDSFISKQGFIALQRNFPRMTADPVRIVVSHASGPQARAGVQRLATALASDPSFGPPTVQRSGDVVMLTAAVRGDPHGNSAISAVRELRSGIIRRAFAGTGATPYVGGTSAMDAEYFDASTNPAPYVFAFVLGLTFVLLTVAFRSIVIAATAIVLNLLSVGAAYGLLVLVFQDGVATGLLGFRHVPSIEAWVPLFLFSVLFGLSMDYQMLLLSRIKERHDLVPDTRLAVAFGVATTARIITGAALIIVAAFAGFAAGQLSMFQQMGFGVGIALLIDATLIRSVLLPAAMCLLGERNWYLPRWLEWLPRIDLEAPRRRKDRDRHPRPARLPGPRRPHPTH